MIPYRGRLGNANHYVLLSASFAAPSIYPMLAEMYTRLKAVNLPTHGSAEIVPVSSERDANGFNATPMPWLSILQSLTAHKQLLGTKYGVRGIPALVVLDAMSGQVVVLILVEEKFAGLQSRGKRYRGALGKAGFRKFHPRVK
jgi:hypothetical protein